MSSTATAATARRITATAKATAPLHRFTTTSQGPYSFRVVMHSASVDDSVTGRAVAAAIRTLPGMTTTWGRDGRTGKIVINVTDEDTREAGIREQEARRTAALEKAREELTVREYAAVARGTADEETMSKVTVRQAAAIQAAEAPVQPAVPSSLSAGPAAREARTYAVGGARAELIALHADPADAIRHAEQVRAAGFGASVYGPCGHPQREYLSRDGVRLLEPTCRRCVQVREAADTLRTGGTLRGAIRAAGVEGEARVVLAAEAAQEEPAEAPAGAERAAAEAARLTAARAAAEADAPEAAAVKAEWDRMTAAAAAAEAPAEPAGELTYRGIRSGAYEVLRGAEVIGRVRRTTPAHATLTARWEAYLPGGGRVTSGAFSRAEAAHALLGAPAPERGYPALTSEEAEEVLRMGAVLVAEGAGGYSFTVQERYSGARLGRVRAVTEELGGGFWVRYAAYRPDGSRAGYALTRPAAARLLLPLTAEDARDEQAHADRHGL